MKHELRALTSMRGIAAWMVVLYHIRLSIAGLPAEAVALFAKGYLAVDFFFLLSGFVIWLAWHERLRVEGWRAVPAFLQKRIARIWPLHLIVLTGVVGLALLFAVTGRADPDHYPFAQLPLHLLLVQNWGFTDRLTWNDPSWSISCELAAYLLFPVLTLAIDWKRVPSAAIVGAIVGMLLLLDAVMRWGGATTLGSDIAGLGLRRCLLEFAAGTAICALWLRWRDRPFVAAMFAAAISVFLFAAWFANALPETLAIPGCFAAALLTLALSSAAAHNPLDARWLHYLGEISYATYLGHFMLFVVFKLVLVDDPRAVPPILIALYLALVLGSSIALYHLVERPAQRWINAIELPVWSRLTRRRADPAASRSRPY